MRQAVPTRVLSAALASTCLLALAACGSDDSDDPTVAVPTSVTNPTGAPTTTTDATPDSTTSPSATPTTSAPATPSTATTPDVRQIVITVKNGEITGDTGLIEVDTGEPFQVVVTSDVADEVHVHSETRAGFSGDVQAGGTVTVPAVIKVPGRYEIELENRGLVLARVQAT